MKNKTIVQVVVNASTKDTVADVVAMVNNLNEQLSPVRARSAQGSGAVYHMGPFEKRWCKFARKSRVRSTDGRSREEQARHNLKSYAALTDEELNAIGGGAAASAHESTENGKSGKRGRKAKARK